jgi:hypothetical protein
VLGEGKLCPRPPTAAFLLSTASDDATESLEWEGDVICDEDVSVGGFSMGKVVVKVCCFSVSRSC